MDISRHTSLAPLADVISDVLRAAERAGVAVFVVGALARDLWFQYAFGGLTDRATQDVDFAVSCRDWATFDELRSALLEVGDFRLKGRGQQKFVHRNGTEIDVVPFGGLERSDRTIAWPPDANPVMNALGFTDLAGTVEPFVLTGGTTVDVVPLASLAVLKLVAWTDRGRLDGKDAYDFARIARGYLDAGNVGRIGEVPSEDFDYEEAGAELLGRDMAGLCGGELGELIQRVLQSEADPDGDLRFAEQAKLRDDTAVRLLQAVRRGFERAKEI